MNAFGRLVARLRTDRGLTQQGLADLVPMSVQNLRRGESSKDCPWRPQTALACLAALERSSPISPHDRREFLTLSGLPALAAATPAPKPPGEDVLPISPELRTVHTWVQRLVEEAGPIRVFAALEALAASWEIDLPPRIRHATAPPPRMLVTQSEQEGFTVRTFTPVGKPPAPSPPAAPPRGKPKRRSA